MFGQSNKEWMIILLLGSVVAGVAARDSLVVEHPAHQAPQFGAKPAITKTQNVNRAAEQKLQSLLNKPDVAVQEEPTEKAPTLDEGYGRSQFSLSNIVYGSRGYAIVRCYKKDAPAWTKSYRWGPTQSSAEGTAPKGYGSCEVVSASSGYSIMYL